MNKRVLYSFILLVLAQVAHGQVKVGDNPAVIDANAVLEIESLNKGLRLPRLALSATNVAAPLTTFVQGMVVYNTASAGAGTTAVSPGLYYCDGVQWVRSSNGSSRMWSLSGTTGSNPATDFIGTTDNNPLILKTNSTEAVRIGANGTVKLSNVPAGNAGTDSVLVLGSDQVIRKIPLASITTMVLRSLEVAVNGQTVFNTPAQISNANKISLYRNGIMIAFTVNTLYSITAEVACYAGDEIRIVQNL